MVKINYAELKFDHVVAFNQENTIFACCRENGSGRTRLFLVFENGKIRVYTRNGRTESWEVLAGQDAENIRNSIHRAINQGITVYQFNGSSQAVTGQIIPAVE